MAATKKTTAGNTRTVSEIKDRLEFNDALFKKTQETLLKIRDPNRQDIKNIIGKDRKLIREYLKNPASNESNLISAARYLFYRTQIFFRLVHFYANMFDFRCRQVIPNISLTKENRNYASRTYQGI